MVHRLIEAACSNHCALAGILAVEIFTGQPVFDVFESKENVRVASFLSFKLVH